jgi:deoxyadenosine/deoxycytidine kinase
MIHFSALNYTNYFRYKNTGLLAMNINTEQKKMIVVEGNIGAGKSTMLSIINKHFNAGVILEPTDKWQNVIGNENLLDLFYKDTPRWAYTFQTNAFLTRIQAAIECLAKPSDKDFFVLERSGYTDRFCFAKNCYEMGLMTPLEWQIYTDWFAWLIEHEFTPKPHGFIYLQTTPEMAYKRTLKRNRSEETGIALSYIQALHNKHEAWLIRKEEISESIRNAPVLVLDCNQDFENDVTYQNLLVQQMDLFIKQLDHKPIPEACSVNTQLHL